MTLLLDPNFCRLSKKALIFFRFSVKFKVALMMFVLFCHQLDNIHVKGNFIRFTLMIESLQVFFSENVSIVLLLDPKFCRLSKKHYFFSIFSQVQSRCDDVCFVLPST